jgi:uncharacterized membrane protein HdeD (DUF308 family)
MLKAALIAAFGVCALIWPTTSLNVLIIAAGVMLVVDGIFGLIGSFRGTAEGSFVGQSLLSLVIGGILLFWPGATMDIMLRLIGVWALLHGAMLCWSLANLPAGEPYRNAQITAAVVVAIIGAVLLFWPGVGTVALSWLLGIAALIIAAVLFWLASRLKALKQRLSDRLV